VVTSSFLGRSSRKKVRIKGRVLSSGFGRISTMVLCLGLSSFSIVLLQSGQAGAAPSSWSVTSSPDPDGGGVLFGDSCPTNSTNFCTAVGYYQSNEVQEQQNLIETWNGSTWSVTPSPDATNTGNDATFNELNGVYCTSATFCIAVGDWGEVTEDSSPYLTLIESWNGTSWSIVSSPNHGGSTSSYLEGVSCSSATNCTAVGDYETNSGVQDSLIESWTGGAWSIVSSPNTSNGAALEGVSCPTNITNYCAAVGSALDSSGTAQMVIESWNGTAWSITPNPTFDGGVIGQQAVSCTSATFCEAVGAYYNDELVIVTLVDTWNGTDWSLTSSPNTGFSDFLDGVSCTSSSNCVADGLFENSSGNNSTLIEAGSGSTWSITSSPNPGNYNDQLAAVSCATDTDCVAVGEDSSKKSTDQTLVETGSTASSPTITGFSPTSGAVGTKVTITGTNLSGAITVTFNGTVATITKNTATKIKVKVPTGATTGKIEVTTAGGTVTSAKKFKVT
jgi:hypothetical protein